MCMQGRNICIVRLRGARSDKALYKPAENKQHGKKAEIIGGEFRDITPGPAGIMRKVY